MYSSSSLTRWENEHPVKKDGMADFSKTEKRGFIYRTIAIDDAGVVKNRTHFIQTSKDYDR